MTPSTGWMRTGRSWVFSEEFINTDAIMPRAGFELPPEQQGELVLASQRPGWSALVEPGDILVVGRGFGSGSSRPAPLVIARLEIVAIVAESVGEIFFRNCISYALPVLECPGVLQLVAEGDEVSVDISTGEFVNLASGASGRGEPMPEALLETIAAGGTHAQLRRDGYF